MSTNHLITLTDINTVSGLSEDSLSALIPYAEAQAEAMLGFLHKDSKFKEIYTWDKTDIIKLDDYPVNSITSITYLAYADDDTETFETDEYRTIVDEGLIIFDSKIPEGYKITVNYEIGWDRTSVTNLVKLFLVALVVNQYCSLNPELTYSSKVITQEKIGDYAVKYSGLNKVSFKSMDEWVDYLGSLIKKGSNLPDSFSI